MFKLSLSSRELFHTNFLEWLSTVDSNSFMTLMKQLVKGSNNTIRWTKYWRVKREFQKLDLCILSYDKKKDYDNDNDNKAKIILVVENKVKSIPYKEQLDDYHQKVEKWNKKVTKKDDADSCIYILLSLAKLFPEKYIIEKGKIWIIRNYTELAKKIASCYLRKKSFKTLEDEIIQDYCQYVSILSELSSVWYNEDYRLESPFLYFYKKDKKDICFQQYEDLRKIRIHDLFQKLKFSHICSVLYFCVKLFVGEITVIPNNGKGLFKNSKDDRLKPDVTFICLNDAFLHGVPLIEINIHPAVQIGQPEYYFTIQVQGDRYEHGIQMKVNKEEEVLKEIGRVLAEYSMDDWMWTVEEKKTDKIIGSRWTGLFGSDLLPVDTNSKLKYYKYYGKQDYYYLYQARKIITGTSESDQGPSICTIVCQMLDDLVFVMNCLK